MKTLKITSVLVLSFLMSIASFASSFEMEKEAYIDDIPFDTECIASNCLYFRAINVEFNLPEESYIDDIPFNTKQIAIELICSN